VPGNPEVVKTRGAELAEMAALLSDQASYLQQYVDGTDSWKGDAQKKFKETAEKVPPKLRKACTRYRLASEALTAYWPHLDSAQTEAQNLRSQAQDVQADIESYQSRVGDQERAERAASEDPTAPAYNGSDYRQLVSGKEFELAHLRSMLSGVVQTLKGHGATAASRIRDASEELEDGDSLWDRAKKGYHNFQKFSKWALDHKAFRLFVEIVKTVAMVLAIAVLLLSNPAGWLVLLAGVVGVLALALGAMEAAAGEQSWWWVALDAALLAVGGAGKLRGWRAGRAGTAVTNAKGKYRAAKGLQDAARKSRTTEADEIGKRLAKLQKRVNKNATPARLEKLAKQRELQNSARDAYAPMKSANKARVAETKAILERQREILNRWQGPVWRGVDHAGDAGDVFQGGKFVHDRRNPGSYYSQVWSGPPPMQAPAPAGVQ